MMQIGIGENQMLIGTEEAQYNEALEQMTKQFVDYYKDMEVRGYIDSKVKSFVKQGVLFRVIK